MTNEYFISIFLDTRREKKNGKYPVKLRVFTPQPRIQKLYPTKFEFTETEFKSTWESQKPRAEFKDARKELKALEVKADEVAKKLPRFTFEAFERAFLPGSSKTKNDIVDYYNQAIEQYKQNKQIGTASNYEYSLKSLLEFHGKDNLSFYAITSQWLKNYENFVVGTKHGSHTTVGMYLRPLRALFNMAILENIIEKEHYPFGKRKYSIPAPKSVKKALLKEQLKVLFDSKPTTPEQEKAKDFWFFSYACNGMNIKDVANLQYKDISGDTLTFRRAKTSNTNKNQAPVIVYLEDFALSVIEKYGNKPASPEKYVFSIIDHTTSPEEQHRQKNIFTKYVNQHFLKYAKSVGINEKVSTYWARHSFATNAIRNGASLEYVQEAFSHSDLKTTIGYFAGFEDEKKREISKKNMEF
jgi:integrase/recombinase XerD